jgi:4-hydroxybenzoate polyprenyltransferase
LCGAALTGVALHATPLLVLAGVGTAFYVGGMLLNDAFDADIDARERPQRPIPSGRVSRREVFQYGFGLLGAGLLLLTVYAALGRAASGWGALAAGAATSVAIVIYNRWHKGHPWSPVVMGACRMGLYAMAALTVTESLGLEVLLPALALLLYVVGLTHIARFETGSIVARVWPTVFVLAPAALAATHAVDSALALSFLALHLGWTLWALGLALRGGPGHIPRAVVSLIAGLSLADAMWIATRDMPLLAAASLLAFGLTLVLQRSIRGT